MHLFDTARKAVVPFEPGPVVTMYTCGITPYDATHLGHAAVYVTYDVLQRRLRDMGHDTKCVRNITDVDDSILAKARSLGVHYLDLAAAETARFDNDMAALNLLPCWSEPRATSAIPDIRGFIGMVLDRGHAYQAGGASTSTSTRSPRSVRSPVTRGARCCCTPPSAVATSTIPTSVIRSTSCCGSPRSTTNRRGVAVGRRPARLAHRVLRARAARARHDDRPARRGRRSDLPHHECERAQSEAATGEPFVRHWMHQAMVRMDGAKMSKSLGNLVFVSDLLKHWDAAVVRTMLVENHYRTAWEWDETRLPRAAARLDRWRAAGEGDGAIDEVRAALDDDLDTPRAVESIDNAAAAGQGVSLAAGLLGVDLTT